MQQEEQSRSEGQTPFFWKEAAKKKVDKQCIEQMQQPVGLVMHPYAVIGKGIVTCQAQEGQRVEVSIEIFGKDSLELNSIIGLDEHIALNVSFVVVIE
ncbi:MAG: Uncharacterised protein [Flavobacteriia bacterium]|nr:MAG: Uncharacterised protein [Flavobacteriia bacterium]